MLSLIATAGDTASAATSALSLTATADDTAAAATGVLSMTTTTVDSASVLSLTATFGELPRWLLACLA